MASGKLPRLPGASGELIRRSSFLNGTHKAYFAPGQWPHGISDAYGYVNPTKWNAAGTLLRVPQMVCFSLAIFPDEVDFTVSYDNGPFDYLGMAAQVKSAIESLRPGRTYVDVMTYSRASLAHPPFFYLGSNNYPNNYPQSFYFGAAHPNITDYLGAGNYYTYMVAPNPSDVYFGTNFLHLYASTANQVGGSVPVNPSGSDPIYVYGKNRIIGSYPKFEGFKVYMYSCINNFNGVTIAAPASQMAEICADLSRYGYEYGGDAISEMTVTNMVSLIAGHFYFDPDTGQDL